MSREIKLVVAASTEELYGKRRTLIWAGLGVHDIVLVFEDWEREEATYIDVVTMVALSPSFGTINEGPDNRDLAKALVSLNQDEYRHYTDQCLKLLDAEGIAEEFRLANQLADLDRQREEIKAKIKELRND